MKSLPLLRLSLLLFVLLLFVTIASADIITIPIIIGQSGLIRVKGKVNGVPTNFILDTGFSPALFIDAKCESTMHFQRTGEFITESELKGAQRIKNVSVELVTAGTPVVIPYKLPASLTEESYPRIPPHF